MKLPRVIFDANCDTKCYSAEASDLRGWQPEHEITIQSDTCEATFVLVNVERSNDEDNELLAWHFIATPATLVTHPRLNGWKVTIFND